MTDVTNEDQKIVFASGLKPARIRRWNLCVDSVSAARKVLAKAGVACGDDGLPIKKDGDIAEKLLADASAYIDGNGNLTALPEGPSPACFGLPRYFRPRKCQICPVRQPCQRVIKARLVFGGVDQFKKLINAPSVDWPSVGVLAAISGLYDWERQYETVRDERRRAQQKLRNERYRANTADERQAERQRREAARIEEKARLEAERAGAIEAAKEEFNQQGISDTLKALADRSDLKRDPRFRRALTDQFEHLAPAWIAEEATVRQGYEPDEDDFIAEAVKAFRLVSNSEAKPTTSRNRAIKAIEAISQFRKMGEEL